MGALFFPAMAIKHSSYNIWMSARDLARFGLLYLGNGQLKSKQILSPDWIETSIKPRFKNIIGEEIPMNYGLLWWISANKLGKYDAYFAPGVGSQSVWVLPKLDIVFVHRASRDYTQGVYGLDVEEILLRLIDGKKENPVSDPELTKVEWSQQLE